MATLFNTKIKDTYQSLLKLEDNTILTTTTKNITDGLGNASPLYMSTTRIGVGTNSPIATLDVNGAARINGALTLPQINAVFLTVGTFTWFADVNNILRLVSGGQNRLNLGTDGVLTTNAYYGSQIGSNTNPEAYSYSIAGNLQVDGVNRNLSNVNKNIFLAQTTGVGSVQNAPILRYFYAVKGAVTGFTSYRGIEIADLDSYFGTTSGNVMIGTTTNAGYKLDVNGTARTGNLTVGTGAQGTVTAGQYDLLYPNHIRYQNAYQLNIVPKDNAGTTVNTGGSINLKADTIQLLHDTQFSMFSGALFNTGDKVTLKKGGSHYLGSYLAIEGADAPSYNYGTRSGSVLIYPGEQTNGNGYGNVILAHSGTSARGNVGVGEASPTARLQVKGSGSTSATTSLLVQNSLGNAALTITDNLNSNFGGNITLTPRTNSINFGSTNERITTDASSNLAFFKQGSQVFTVEGGGIRTTGTISAGSSITFGNNTYVGVNGNEKHGIGTTEGHSFYLSSGVNSLKAKMFYPSGNMIIQDGGTFSEISSSRFTVNSTTQGFLPPRMTTAEKNAIATPATGLMVFDTDLARPCFFNGATWITL